ncbi:MAG TPA: multicopper oxidase domain-containing protein, partial [Planctomycetota bacterium]|nr:multicopper oxidase domain-containing protein [Planctomycetota bacterium]
RVVNAAASSYFYVASALGSMQVVAADGHPIEPFDLPRLLIGIAETYDLMVTMPETLTQVEVRATAHDGTGHASVWLGQGPKRLASDPPKPDIYTLDEFMAAGLASQSEERARQAIERERPFPPYAYLRSPVVTTLVAPEDEPKVRKITMRLTGEMQRYLWGFDGKTLSEESVIRVSQGEVLRIEFINDTMMHHPLHLHGHFFRLLNGQGEYSPLKHTVDVPPMGRRTIEWVADEEPGDWFFHCHILYHMDAGMARVFSYRELGDDHQPAFDPNMIRPRMVKIRGMVVQHMSMGMAMVMEGKNDYYVRWDAAYNMHMGHMMDGHRDQEVDLGYSRYIDPNWSAFAAYRFSKVRNTRDRAVVGARYRMPYLVWTTLSAA